MLVPVKGVDGAQQSSGEALGLYLSSSQSVEDAVGKRKWGHPPAFLSLCRVSEV